MLIAGGIGAPHAAEVRIAVIRDDVAITRQVTEALARAFARHGWISNEVSLGDDRLPPDLRRDDEQALVALGPRALAAALKQAAGRPVVGALIPRGSVEELPSASTGRWSAIILDQPVERWLALVQAAFPTHRRVGLLAGPGNQKLLRSMEGRAQDRQLELAVEGVNTAAEVVPALEKLLPRMAVLLALPDPVVHNRNSVQPVLLTTYRAGIPVVAYSESYQHAGAALTLYSTMPQVAYQVTDTLQQFFDGRTPPNIQSPRYFTVGINSAVARSLGLQLPSASELQERLRPVD